MFFNFNPSRHRSYRENWYRRPIEPMLQLEVFSPELSLEELMSLEDRFEDLLEHERFEDAQRLGRFIDQYRLREGL